MCWPPHPATFCLARCKLHRRNLGHLKRLLRPLQLPLKTTQIVTTVATATVAMRMRMQVTATRGRLPLVEVEVEVEVEDLRAGQVLPPLILRFAAASFGILSK